MKNDFYKTVAMVLQAWLAIDNKNAEDLMLYLNEQYVANIKSLKEISLIIGYRSNSSKHIKSKKFAGIWERFVQNENHIIANKLFGKNEIGITYKYDEESAKSLYEEEKNRALYFISWNTLIGEDEWGWSPAIHLHLATLNKLATSISFNKKYDSLKPVQSRIIFLSETREEFIRRAACRQKFEFIYDVNAGLNVRLAFIPLDTVVSIILENKDFFNNHHNLEDLGFSNEHAHKVTLLLKESNIDTISLKLLMKNILLRQMHVSDSIKITGMDFLQVFHDYINFEPENSSMWTMHKDVDKGISYTKFNVRRSAPQVADLSVFELTGFERAFLAKLRFSKLVLDKIANATDTGIIFKPEYTFESLFNS